jgi:hypothetical protein
MMPLDLLFKFRRAFRSAIADMSFATMTLATVSLAAMTLLVASVSASHAGSCAADIDAMQARIDSRLEAIAERGRFAPEGVSAGMSNQPTPRSIAAAEVKLGELNSHMVRNVRRAMARARVADARGNERRCEKELERVRRALGP